MSNKNNKIQRPITVKSFNFSNQPTQLPVERNKGGRKGADVMVYWGDVNLYPNFLLGLLKDSPYHKGIINTKYNYVHGNGIIFKDTDQYADFKVNEKDTIVDFFKKVTRDYLVFNAYAVEVIYNKAGEQIRYNHIPVDRLRTSKNKQHFWYSDDWYLKSNECIHFDAWRKNENEEFTSKIYYYEKYTQSPSYVYPVPDYSGGIVSIENEIAIRDFHKNNLRNNFSVSSVITFFGGTPEDEVADKIVEDISNTCQGVDGKRVLVNFADESGKGAEITNISASDFNEAFTTLRANTIEDIVSTHSLPSVSIAGVAIPNKLGGSNEKRQDYQEFRNSFVLNAREEMLASLNNLFEGYFQELDIKDDADRFGSDDIDPLLKEIMTLNELREMRGLPKIEGGDTFLSNMNKIQSQPAQPVVNESKFSKDEDADETFDKIQHFGLEKDDYIVLRSYKFSENLKFDSDQRLTNYLVENQPFAGQSLRSIREKLDDVYTIQQIREELARLVNAKVIPMTHLIDRVDIQEQARKMNVNPSAQGTSNLQRIQIMYSYDGPIDEKNRKFCSKLATSNKLFSREEIEQMSQVLGYQIFEHKGGRNCRHTWTKHSVVRRG